MKTLDEIMLSVKTDKNSKHHNYTPIYESLFSPLREQPITFVEIGVGNKNDPNQGESLLGWNQYFPNAKIVGIDIDDKSDYFPDEPRINTYRGSSDDPLFLTEVVSKIDSPSIILDDGPHWKRHIVVSFETLFPFLRSGGIYVIEDLHTNYWTGWQGSPVTDDFGLDTTMNYFFKMCHLVNFQEKHVKHWSQVPKLVEEISPLSSSIESISFLRSLIVIRKK